MNFCNSSNFHFFLLMCKSIQLCSNKTCSIREHEQLSLLGKGILRKPNRSLHRVHLHYLHIRIVPFTLVWVWENNVYRKLRWMKKIKKIVHRIREYARRNWYLVQPYDCFEGRWGWRFKHPVILCVQRTRGKCLEELWPLPIFQCYESLEKARIALL